MEPSLRLLAPACLAGSLLFAGCSGSRPEPRVTLTCVGDVMLGRGVRRLCESRGNDYPLEHVAQQLQASDLTFGNLESPLTGGATRFPRVNALLASPEMAPVLAEAGFDVLSLANNHAIDGRRRGLAECRRLLAAAGITPVGAGGTLAAAEEGAVITVRGLRVGFLAFSHFPYTSFVHDPDRESIAMLNEEALRRTVPVMAERSDVVAVSFHWGQEGDRKVTSYERGLAHLAVDLGVDLVVGHHAHVRGPIERYRDGLIAYCLGNLVFDDDSYGGNEGYILTCTLSSAGVTEYDALPVRVVDGQATIEPDPESPT
jgi:poly-gamma-glutamate synthesis protein (capsule biosynthesis protein)